MKDDLTASIISQPDMILSNEELKAEFSEECQQRREPINQMLMTVPQPQEPYNLKELPPIGIE